MSNINQWVPSDLPAPNKKTSLVDDLTDLIWRLWVEDENNFRGVTTSTGKDDAVEGSVTIDKTLMAYLLKKAAGEGTRVGDSSVAEISRVVHHAAKRFGIDRKSIAARKAQWAIEQQHDNNGEFAIV